MIGNVYAGWTLTVVFGVTGLLFTIGRGGRLSRCVHVAGSMAMIMMAWSREPTLPVWPQVLAFALAAGWFTARVVRERFGRPQPGGTWWHDFHHAAMAGALAWSIAATSDPGPIGHGGDVPAGADMMPMPHHQASAPSVPAAPANPGNAIAAVVFTVYFIVVAWPWMAKAVAAARKSGATTEPHDRRPALEAASHAIMSIGMAAMFVVMA